MSRSKRQKFLNQRRQQPVNNRMNGGIPINVPLIGQQQQQPEFKPQYMAVSGPTAHPVVVIVPTEHGPCPVVYGGLKREEAMASQIAAGLLAQRGFLEGDTGLFNTSIATRAVDIALAIIAECERRTKQAQQQESA